MHIDSIYSDFKLEIHFESVNVWRVYRILSLGAIDKYWGKIDNNNIIGFVSQISFPLKICIAWNFVNNDQWVVKEIS